VYRLTAAAHGLHSRVWSSSNATATDIRYWRRKCVNTPSDAIMLTTLKNTSCHLNDIQVSLFPDKVNRVRTAGVIRELHL
jgi:hypothetical protein